MDDTVNFQKYEQILYTHSNSYVYISKGLTIVETYIKKNKFKIYGGMAIDLALKKMKHIGIYPPDTIPDYDFYSNDSINDGNKLGLILKHDDMPNISVINAIHKSTRRIRIQLETVADITYMPNDIYSHIPTLTHMGFVFVHPHYQMIDMHRAMNYIFENPPDEVFNHRIKKDMCRYSLLKSVYPVICKMLKPSVYNTLSIIKPLDDNELLAGIPIYSIYYQYILDLQGDKNKLKDIIPMTITNLKIEYPQEFDDIMKWGIISDDYLKYDKEGAQFFNPIINLYPEHIKIDNITIYNNMGNKISCGKLYDMNVPNIQWYLMHCMYNYHLSNDDRFLMLYVSTSKLLDIAVEIYESLTDDLKQDFLHKPFFLNNITYGSTNTSDAYKTLEKNKRAFINQTPIEKNIPNNFYPNNSEEWDTFDYSLFKIDGEKIDLTQ